MHVSSKGILSSESLRRIQQLKSRYPKRKSAVLMVLHAIYDQFGYLNREALKNAAELMELPLIDFEQAASFYTWFPKEKVGKYHIQVCRTLPCELRGAEGLLAFLKEKLAIEVGGVTKDGLFSLATVECLGSCSDAPVMQINDTYYRNLNRARVEQILGQLREKG